MLNLLNNSKFLAGVAILMSNIGGRYLNLDLTKNGMNLLNAGLRIDPLDPDKWAKSVIGNDEDLPLLRQKYENVLITVVTTLEFIKSCGVILSDSRRFILS